MPIQDYSLPPGTRLLMGDDLLDLTPALGGLRLAQPLADLKEPVINSANITLESVVGFPESLDRVENAGRWQRGKHPIRLYLYDTLIATLRLRAYHYDENTGVAELIASDLLGLLNTERSKSADSGFQVLAVSQFEGSRSFSFQSRAAALVRVLVNGSVLDGVQYLGEGQIDTSTLPEYRPDGRPDGFTSGQGMGKTNPVQHAQEMVAAIGYWLWCDPFEIIRCVPYPTDTPTPARRYARSEVEKFQGKRSDAEEGPPSTVKAIGTRLVSCKVLNPAIPEQARLIPPGFGVTYPIISEARGDGGVVVQRVTRYGSEDEPYSRVVVEQSLSSLMPDEYPDDGTLATASTQERKETYNDEGFLLLRVVTNQLPLGVLDPDNHPGETALAKTIETEKWTYIDGVPSERSLIITRPAYAVYGDPAAGQGQTLFAGEIETWVPIGTRKYEHLVVKTKPRGLVADAADPYDRTPTIVSPTAPDFVEAPPEGPSKPAPAPVAVVAEAEEARVAPRGESGGYAGKPITIRFACSSDRANARAIAQFQARLEWQRASSYTVTRPFDPTCDLGFGFIPFQREDVHNRALIRDGYNLAIGDDGLSVAYTGNLIGTIATVPDPYEAPAIVPDLTNPTPPLSLAPLPPLTFVTGTPISPFALAAAGGAG